MSPELEVSGKQLARALSVLRRNVRLRHCGEAVLSFEEGELRIDLGGATVRAPALGDWPGQARLPGRVVLQWSGIVRGASTVKMRVEGGRLSVSNWSFPCQWDESPVAGIEWPLNPSALDILALRYKYSEEQIDRAGLMPVLKREEERRDKRILQAASLLEPYGVTPEDLRDLIDACIRRLTGTGEA